ncbi:hypothetical protein CEE37_14155 [candidate division LCP-89 bacterium B3_LCP]|uniref:FlgD/Vpr Ig-like domain-containing protein n=1 Tax=candidate division LCP-89 bacterium B3_LCP TaxID=2012998 RepID=A0A532UQT0_UNCL8|nr:MAG: hypothetical protein CEE37_14155 [candidate division LCP-89 bacterium B3_LCP]
MKRTMKIIVLTTLASFLLLGSTVSAGFHGKHQCGQHGKGIMASLTTEQRDQVFTMIQEMHDQGKAPDEIHAAVRTKLEGFGIEVPDTFMMGPRHHGQGMKMIHDQLNESQQKEIREMVCQMHQDGKQRDEIHAAVKVKLESYGIDVPENFMMMHGKHRGPGMKMIHSQLNEVQRDAIRSQICEMRQSGTSQQEIQSKVQEMVKGYGIELPDGNCIGGNWGSTSPEILDGAELTNTTIKATSHPNPFNPDVTISYELQDAGQVTVQIYDLQGQSISTVKNGYQNAGSYEVVWNGKNANGQKVSSGTYFYKITAGDQTLTKQIIMTK